MSVLVHELLSLELWRDKVFPLLMTSSTHPTSGFPAYLVVSHKNLVLCIGVTCDIPPPPSSTVKDP